MSIYERQGPPAGARPNQVLAPSQCELKSWQLSKLLDLKNLGPYKIVRTINNIVYEFKLSKSITRVFLVFHL